MKRLFAGIIVTVMVLTLCVFVKAEGGLFVDPMPFRGTKEMIPYGAGGNHFSENVGGGRWEHGTVFILPMAKQAYSNYYHATADHRSSCRVGKKYHSSGFESGGNTSYSQVTGFSGDVSRAWWSKNPL